MEGISATVAGGARRRRPPLLRVLPAAAYVGLACTVFATRGIPFERGMLMAWILGALFCLSLGSLSSFVRGLLVDWLPLLAALTLYDVLRGVGAGRVPVHDGFQIWLDRDLFGGGTVPTVWLQQHLWDAARLTPLDYTAWAVYMSYYLVTPLLLGVIWMADRQLFRRYARQLTLLCFAAVAAFTVSPTIPPWLAARKGMIGDTARLIGPIGRSVPQFDPTPLWERGVRLANDLAAFPSLHEAMTVLVAVVLWRRVPREARALLVAYPLAMAFALVYTGEHYVSDLVAGALLTAAVVAVEPRLTERVTALRARRRKAVEPAFAHD
jgi:membrane-associated phospholipid phosphatase